MNGNDECSAARNFFCNIITEDDVLTLEVALKKIWRAPPPARNYFDRRCRDVRELEEFFKDNDYLFFLENKRVALHDESLEKDSEDSVKYFKDKLQEYCKPVPYTELKETYLKNAPSTVCDFMSRFYPASEFKEFFQRRPDIFYYQKDKSVSLIELESVTFYKSKLKVLKGQKQPFMNFRGHIGHAPQHIQAYINKYYLGDDFQTFLLRNNGVFRLDDKGFVSLVSSK